MSAVGWMREGAAWGGMEWWGWATLSGYRPLRQVDKTGREKLGMGSGTEVKWG